MLSCLQLQLVSIMSNGITKDCHLFPFKKFQFEMCYLIPVFSMISEACIRIHKRAKCAEVEEVIAEALKFARHRGGRQANKVLHIDSLLAIINVLFAQYVLHCRIIGFYLVLCICLTARLSMTHMHACGPLIPSACMRLKCCDSGVLHRFNIFLNICL